MVLGYGPGVSSSLKTYRNYGSNHRNTKKRLWISQKGKCKWCGQFCMYHCNGGVPTEFTVDHVVPLSHGGTNHWMNVVGSCHRCNNKRNRRWEKLERVEL